MAKKLIFCLLTVGLLNCSGGDDRIAVPGGNESVDVVGTQVRITPESSDDIYTVTFTDADSAVVTRSQDIGGGATLIRSSVKVVVTPIETVDASYQEDEGTVTLTVSFSDGTELVITLVFNSDGEIESTSLTIDGVEVEASGTVVEESNEGTSAEALNDGLAELASQDLDGAEAAFCNELADDPTNSSLAFGCFWAKLFLLSESNTSVSLLAVFGEAFDVDAQLLGANGLFANLDLVLPGNRFPIFNYTGFDLPFAGLFNQFTEADDLVGQLLQTAIDNGITVGEMQDLLDDLIPEFSELEALLAIVVADSNFSFSIPSGFFSGAASKQVGLDEARLYLAAVKLTIVQIDFLNAYDFGVTIEDFVSGGQIDVEILVEDLNGTGQTVNNVTVDQIVFMTLEDADRVTNSESRFVQALSLAETAFQNLNATITSKTPLGDPTNFDDELDLIDELQSALSGMTQISSIDFVINPISINLDAFFANPPDASTVSVGAGDPFVLEEDGIGGVEVFFEEMLDGYATF